MTADDRFTKHAKLLTRMADKVGVDLTEEMQRSKLDAEDLRMMVHRCEGCTDPDACIHLLENGAPTQFPPSYSRNAETFAAMNR